MRHAMKARLLATLFLVGCTSPAPAPVAVAPAGPPAAPIASGASSSAPPPARPPREAKPIVLAGPNVVQNAAWVDKGYLAAVTRNAVWRVRPEAPDVVKITPLAGTLGNYAVIAAAQGSSAVAAALDDGQVEVLDENGHRHTLPAGPQVHVVLDMKLSPDGKVLAVTRDGPTWKEETTFFELTSGTALGKIDGGQVVFDPTSKYVAGRGGVSTLDGKTVAAWKEGFNVLDSRGRIVPMNQAAGAEVMAGDYVARGWFKGQAVYAGSHTVELIDPATGKATPIDAKCGSGGKKISSTAHLARGRVIGVCEEAILVTDLDTRTTKAISVFVQKGGIIFPTEVFFASDSDDFGLIEGKNGIFVHDGAVRTDPYAHTQIFELQRRDVEACVHPDTPRKSIKCSSPATRQDGQYVAHANHALTVTNRGGQSVIDWSSHSQDWRVDRTAAFPSAPCGPPPPSSGSKEWSEREAADTFRAYTSIRSGGGRVTAYLTCICSASGCRKTELAGFLDEPFAFRDDGTILTESTNPTMTETVITLRRPQKPNVQKKIAERCLSGRFGPGGRVFMLCEANERSTIYELGATDLAVVGKRFAPPIGLKSLELHQDELVLHGADSALIVPVDWVKDATKTERASIYAGYHAAVTVQHDGKVDVQGDPEEASQLLRCYDGERLRPFATCR